MWIILIFLLMSCRIDTIPEVDTIVETIPEVAAEAQETTLHGTYRRAIGSQYEVYEFSDQLTTFIETDGIRTVNGVYDYTYDEDNIFIGADVFPYILEVDKIVICGYTYYRL